MKPIANWEDVRPAQEFIPLPKGGYVCQIQGARIKEYTGQNGSFERLEIALDICEGEFKDYYRKDFEAQNTEDRKWRGVLRLFLPKEDASQQDEWAKSRLKSLIGAIEDSNPGYHWDWDETKLKGKRVGCLFRAEEWEFAGRSGWKTQPFKAMDVQSIRDGKFALPKDKPLNRQPIQQAAEADFSAINLESDDDLPF